MAVVFCSVAARPSNSLDDLSAVATSVTCGGRTWTDGEVLGQHNHDGTIKDVMTMIHEGRIYLRYRNEPAMGNFAIIYHLTNGRFPHSQNAGFDNCINSADPSTNSSGYLGPLVNNTISCNGDVYTDGLWLGDYRGGDNVITKQYAIIENGLLRVNYHREGTPYQRKDISSGLIKQTIDGENGSIMNPNLGFTITKEEIDACFWGTLPKYPDGGPVTNPDPDPNPNPGGNCERGPVLGNITNIATSGLTFQFDGNGVNTIKWEVKSGNSVVASGTTPQLTSAVVNISYGTTLTAGQYTLEIQGGSCVSSVSSRAFTVTPPNCATTPIVGTISNISQTGLTFAYNGSGINSLEWEIRSGVTIVAKGVTGTLTGSTASIVYSTLAAGNYTLAIKGASCSSGFNTRAFTVPLSDTRQNCDQGPELREVYDVTSTGLRFNFYGNNVFQIDWKIKQNGNVIKQNRLSPTNDRPTVNFDLLQDGQYTLEIEGGSCKSTPSSMAFALNVPLYITISEFSADQSKLGVDLKWKVVEEENGERFEVIRYDAGLANPTTIGTVYLRDNALGNYNFLDQNPATGVNYYQLKMIDKDGTFSESRVIAVNYNHLFEAMVSPNPAADFVNVSFVSKVSGTATAHVYNLAGQKVKEFPMNLAMGNNRHEVIVNGLPEGHYFIKITSGSQQMNLRFIKGF